MIFACWIGQPVLRGLCSLTLRQLSLNQALLVFPALLLAARSSQAIVFGQIRSYFLWLSQIWSWNDCFRVRRSFDLLPWLLLKGIFLLKSKLQWFNSKFSDFDWIFVLSPANHHSLYPNPSYTRFSVKSFAWLAFEPFHSIPSFWYASNYSLDLCLDQRG